MDVFGISNQQEIAATQEITSGLCMDFVSWIDRSEKTTRSYLVNLRQFMAWLQYTKTRRPVRKDIILYREWLTAEHDAIMFDPETGWKYRTDRIGNPVRVSCKPNTVAQYLRSICQFFRWTAANNIYPNIAANIHAPKVLHDTHRKEALTPAQRTPPDESSAA